MDSWKAGTFRGSTWIPEGRPRYGRPARSGCSAAGPREGPEAAGTGAARGSSSSTHPCPRTRTGNGVAARRGGLRGDHPERRRGAAPGGTRAPGRQSGRTGLTAASTTGTVCGSGTGEPAGTTVHRTPSSSTDPGAASGGGQNRHCPRKQRCVLRPTGVEGGGPSVSGGPTPGAAFADGRGLGSVRCAHHSRHRGVALREGAPGAPSPRGNLWGRRGNRTG